MGIWERKIITSFSIFMLSPLPLSFLSTLSLTLLTLSLIYAFAPHIYSVALSHLSISLFLFFHIFKTLPNPGLLWHTEELSSNTDDEEKPEYSTVQRNPHVNLILSEGL